MVRKYNIKLVKKFQEDLGHLNKKEQYITAYRLGLYESHVKDNRGDFVVDLLEKTCTCGLPQLLGILCEHTISSAQHRSVDIYSLCSPFYLKDTWIELYKESISCWE